MSLSQVGLFPLLSVTFALLAFFIGYAVALKNDHVDAWLPFISDCGNLPPESCIFGQLLNISCLLLSITIYLIHRNTMVFYNDVVNKDIGRWKYFSLFLMFVGWFAALGASMVANFQEGNVLAAHDTGAFGFFIGIMLYFWGQVVIAYSLKPRIVPIHLTNFRALINIGITGLLIFHLTCLFSDVFVNDVNGTKPVKPAFPNGIERYNSSSPFYANHLATTTSEWIMALLIELFVLTYTFDFAFTILHAPILSRGHTESSLASESRVIDAFEHRNELKLRTGTYEAGTYRSPEIDAVSSYTSRGLRRTLDLNVHDDNAYPTIPRPKPNSISSIQYF